MARLTRDVSPEALAAFDALIDVRSPAEFAEDHLPGAINLPVLDDAQRVEVGTLYVQKSKFEARRLGAAMVARNIATHLDGVLSDRPGAFRPLVYCWRGGQRSGAMVSVMDQVGWPVTQLEGGYQTWRRHVVASLHDPAQAPRVILLDGPTGAGKTALLAALSARGVQTLDLEGLANHRGSLFGAAAEPQPDQKLFESRLAAALAGCDPNRPMVVEAESSRIGRLIIPHGLWSAMKAAPAITLDVPIAARVRRTVEEYADIANDLSRLQAAHRRPARPSQPRGPRRLAGPGPRRRNGRPGREPDPRPLRPRLSPLDRQVRARRPRCGALGRDRGGHGRRRRRGRPSG
ncbi:tRNA 2-selenouridine(34) synthase MnmH [Brevundimonas denitrificans]|uniref:tRNA 2-selenouridine(34) synthase MnmH n=1 Tax=Brevundimonas denitrificans TaxID=1443434 RepID=UPI00223B26F6|nr:tRNA 2-selenouridine(34) synthase MnmH [Brevundimonas denitrificans]